MVMYVKSLVDGCDTNDQGMKIYDLLSPMIRQGVSVDLDFFGVSNVTSSFVNSSLVQLIDDFGYDRVRSVVNIKGVNKQIGTLLRDRMTKLAA